MCYVTGPFLTSIPCSCHKDVLDDDAHRTVTIECHVLSGFQSIQQSRFSNGQLRYFWLVV